MADVALWHYPSGPARPRGGATFDEKTRATRSRSHGQHLLLTNQTTTIMKICIFCSANSNIDPDFFTATEELGCWAAKNGHSIVFGGCDLGLMECIGRTARENGAMTIGIVPSKVEERGRTSRHIDVHIPCDNLNDRKALMTAQSDVFIALPGGIGTLDEIFTVAASATIGYHSKRIVLYNMKGFWNSLIAMLDDLQERGFVRGNWRERIFVASNLDEIAGFIGSL